MRKFAGLIATLSLGAAIVTVPAIAQDAATATASAELSAGAKVFDSEGAELGTVLSAEGSNVVVDLGAGKQVTLPGNAFGKLEQGPAIGATRAQVLAAVDQAAADNDAKLAAALTPGADVLSSQGSAIVGQVKRTEADGVVLTTPNGDVKLPRTAFFVGQAGLSTSFTADEFAAAVAQATGEVASQPGVTAAAETSAPDTSAN